jgi:hypothetical protein
MNRRFFVMTLLLLSAGREPVAAQDPAQKIDLKILYAGPLGHPRTKDFEQFLAKTFKEVGTVELKLLDQKAAAKYDVVIVDSPSIYEEEAETRPGQPAGKLPQAPVLTTEFTKPTILIGAAGGMVLGRLRITLQWL